MCSDYVNIHCPHNVQYNDIMYDYVHVHVCTSCTCTVSMYMYMYMYVYITVVYVHTSCTLCMYTSVQCTKLMIHVYSQLLLTSNTNKR